MFVVGFWRPTVLTIGLVTMIGGGLLRCASTTSSCSLGTVSQLGFLVVLFGAGTSAMAAAGCVLLVAHAAFKGALFMVVGMPDKRSARDLRELPPLGPEWRRWPSSSC